MPTVTFSSRLHKDKTVYAVAGSHRIDDSRTGQGKPRTDRFQLRQWRVRHLPRQGVPPGAEKESDGESADRA